ncbi:MAG: hypothetical protein ACT4PP_00560 [Sporichthyaceae bacterium]
MARRRVIGVLAAGALLGGALSGCGGDSGARLELSPAAAIAKVAQNAGTESATYTLKVSGSGLSLRANGVYRGGPDPVAALTFTALDVAGFGLGGKGVELRLVDDVAYLRMGESGRWLRVADVDGAGESAGESAGGSSFADPVGALKEMLATEDVREIGPANVDGAKTTHYQVRTAPAEFGEGVAATVDVWVDSDYRARKLVLEVPILRGARMELKFRDFGDPVDVRAPADSEIAEGADLGETLLGGGFLGDLFGGFAGRGGIGEAADLEELLEEFERELGSELGPSSNAAAVQ